MSVKLPNGAQLAIASAFGASKSMTAVSNASQAVATLESSHGVIANDILVVTSGWARLNDRVVRAESVSTNDVTLDDIDTSDTTYYPATSGTGSVREVSTWQAITQVLGFSTSGGDMRRTNYQFLDEFDERSLPAGVSAKNITLELGDDQSLAWWTVLRAASDAKTAYPLRITLPGGAKIYANGVWHFDETPSMNKDQIMVVRATIDLSARITRYAS